jgi:hypothetical protein
MMLLIARGSAFCLKAGFQYVSSTYWEDVNVQGTSHLSMMLLFATQGGKLEASFGRRLSVQCVSVEHPLLIAELCVLGSFVSGAFHWQQLAHSKKNVERLVISHTEVGRLSSPYLSLNLPSTDFDHAESS